MQRLLQDTKEVRSEYVVSLGSATYGSLVRRLLGGQLAGPTLLIGAGQLAETILPFLDSGEVLVWNRSAERATAMLARQRVAQTQGRVHLLESTSSAEDGAWRRAHDVVICVPADASRDAQRMRLWQQHGEPAGRVLHLGIHDAEGTGWAGLPRLATLTDLFGLRDTQASQRELQLARARRACPEQGAAGAARRCRWLARRQLQPRLGRSRRVRRFQPLESGPMPMKKTLRLGTRRSPLAWIQSSQVAAAVRAAHPDVEVELVGIETRGDRVLDKPLAEIEGKEFFTAELDLALRERRVDSACTR